MEIFHQIVGAEYVFTLRLIPNDVEELTSSEPAAFFQLEASPNDHPHLSSNVSNVNGIVPFLVDEISSILWLDEDYVRKKLEEEKGVPIYDWNEAFIFLRTLANQMQSSRFDPSFLEKACTKDRKEGDWMEH